MLHQYPSGSHVIGAKKGTYGADHLARIVDDGDDLVGSHFVCVCMYVCLCMGGGVGYYLGRGAVEGVQGAPKLSVHKQRYKYPAAGCFTCQAP